MHRRIENIATPQADLASCLLKMARGRSLARSLRMESHDPFAGFEKPLLDAVSLFEELNIPYALIGGLAAMVWGRARFTEDVDFVAGAGHEAILAAHPDAMRRHHFDPSCTWKLYHSSGVEIDVWKDQFADAIVQRATPTMLGGRSVRIAEPHDLIAMKLRADRPQDDYDISEILKHTPINDQRVRDLVTPEQFAHYESIKARSKR